MSGLDAPPPVSPLRVLGAPLPVNDGEPKVAPSAAPRLAAWPSTARVHKVGAPLPWHPVIGATASAARMGSRRHRVSAQLDGTTGRQAGSGGAGGGKVPWWQPAACPAWHGEPRSRAPYPHPTKRPSSILTHTHTSPFVHLSLNRYFKKDRKCDFLRQAASTRRAVSSRNNGDPFSARQQ